MVQPAVGRDLRRSRDATEVVDAHRSYGAEVLHTAHDGARLYAFAARRERIYLAR